MIKTKWEVKNPPQEAIAKFSYYVLSWGFFPAEIDYEKIGALTRDLVKILMEELSLEEIQSMANVWPIDIAFSSTGVLIRSTQTFYNNSITVELVAPKEATEYSVKLTEYSKVQKIIVSKFGKEGLKTLLPKICAPWFSMGDEEILRQIGEELDEYPTEGSNEPPWEITKKITELHHCYTRPEGGYRKQIGRGDLYAPGSIVISPTYCGQYNTWHVSAIITAAVGRSVSIHTGSHSVCIDFLQPSESSAGEIINILQQEGIDYEAQWG